LPPDGNVQKKLACKLISYKIWPFFYNIPQTVPIFLQPRNHNDNNRSQVNFSTRLIIENDQKFKLAWAFFNKKLRFNNFLKTENIRLCVVTSLVRNKHSDKKSQPQKDKICCTKYWAVWY
jgi:hypothetical protein